MAPVCVSDVVLGKRETNGHENWHRKLRTHCLRIGSRVDRRFYRPSMADLRGTLPLLYIAKPYNTLVSIRRSRFPLRRFADRFREGTNVKKRLCRRGIRPGSIFFITRKKTYNESDAFKKF